MRILKNAFDYTFVLKKSILFLLFVILNHLEKTVLPYSMALYVTALYSGGNIFWCSILFVLSFLMGGGVGLLGCSSIACLVMMTATFIHRKLKIKPNVAFSFYSIIAILGFLILGDTKTQIEFYTRALVSIFIVVLTVISVTAGKATLEKGLKFKLGFEEFATIAIMISLLGLGVCNLFSPLVWKTLSVLILLYVCYFFKLGTGVLISCVLGLSLAIYYGNANYMSVFLILALSAESLMKFSRFASATVVICADYLCFVLFKVYTVYELKELLPMIIGSSIFILSPTIILKKIKEKLYVFRERQLVRQTINRNRLMLSNKLYELSGVFLEISNAFNLFEQKSLTDEKVKSAIKNQIYSTVCKECENFERCKKEQAGILSDLSKMTDIGFAKGKLTLIDMPKTLSSNCTRPNNILYGLNKLLADYRAYRLDNENVATGRELVAAEAVGIAEILRSLALETGQTLKYQSRLERKLSDILFKNGFIVTEILVYGENERLSVSMIIAMKEFSIQQLQNVISNVTSMPMLLTEKADITEDKCYLSFSKACDYDAVFGIAKATKNGSSISGDTHSIMRISGDKFLVALSDGMGSGKNAESISSASLSLIECFYKAGLNSNLILSTVNTLLAINTEDSFAALDISVIDLKSCTADFIKYGSPYGFIVNDNGIKIIEGTSLPIGIIDKLKPSICSSQLLDGDMIILLSDGISDAFGSSGEIIDFLRTLPAKNPQTLANQMLNQAIALNDGQKKDDMTALTVRVFKRSI